MIELNTRVSGVADAGDSLSLPFELRMRARQRVLLDSGKEAAVKLAERGKPLRGGDRLTGPSGLVVVIRAAAEAVSTAASADSQLLARAAYHLGNRHVPLQVGDRFVRYQRDHVLDDMVRALGLTLKHEEVGFEPEAGAYDHSHAHQHDHDHHHPPHDHPPSDHQSVQPRYPK